MENALYIFFAQMHRKDFLGNSLLVRNQYLRNTDPYCLPELCWNTACSQHLWKSTHKHESIACGKTGSREVFLIQIVIYMFIYTHAHIYMYIKIVKIMP